MRKKKIGKYEVFERENFSDICRESKTETHTINEMILIDELVGKNHFLNACKQAVRLDNRDNPSKEKIELNRKIISIVNKDSRWVSDDYYLEWSIKELKQELKRLQDINQNV